MMLGVFLQLVYHRATRRYSVVGPWDTESRSESESGRSFGLRETFPSLVGRTVGSKQKAVGSCLRITRGQGWAAEQGSFSIRPPPTVVDYADYDRLTRTYVNDCGFVDYSGLKRELPVLRSFVVQLLVISPDNRPDLFPSDGERLRYYMTAYNAWVLYIAASEYPSRYSLWRLGIFRNRDIKLGGRDLSLNELEHGIIRKRFQDPRIHFYINCAAASCPPLERGAIPPGKTDEVLDRAAQRFINNTAHVRYDAQAKRLYLSKIFDWFEDDFLNFLRAKHGIQQPHVSQYILIYLAGASREAPAKTPTGELSIRHLSYDESLNEQKIGG